VRVLAGDSPRFCLDYVSLGGDLDINFVSMQEQPVTWTGAGSVWVVIPVDLLRNPFLLEQSFHLFFFSPSHRLSPSLSLHFLSFVQKNWHHISATSTLFWGASVCKALVSCPASLDSGRLPP